MINAFSLEGSIVQRLKEKQLIGTNKIHLYLDMRDYLPKCMSQKNCAVNKEGLEFKYFSYRKVREK